MGGIRRMGTGWAAIALLGGLAGCAAPRAAGPAEAPATTSDPDSVKTPIPESPHGDKASPVRTLYDADRHLNVANYLINATAGLAIGTVIHETGHAMVAYTAGARITRFDVFLAHGEVEYEGDLRRDQQALLAANGMLMTRLTSEILTAELQRGKFDPKWEPFVATTALICRVDAYKQILQGLTTRSESADAVALANDTSLSNGALFGIMAADVAIDLLWRHDMEALWGVARGKKSYHAPEPEKPAVRLEVAPGQAAITVTLPF